MKNSTQVLPLITNQRQLSTSNIKQFKTSALPEIRGTAKSKLQAKLRAIENSQTLSPRAKQQIINKLKKNMAIDEKLMRNQYQSALDQQTDSLNKSHSRRKSLYSNRSRGALDNLNQSQLSKSLGKSLNKKIKYYQTNDGKSRPIHKFETLHIGNCPDSLRQRVFIVEQTCGHSYSPKCSLNLIKITKIKKGFKLFNKGGDEVIKCPKCHHQVNILGEEKFQEILELKDYDEDRIKKMEKYQESLKSNYIGPPCHSCPNQVEKPPHQAQFECLNCQSTLLCYDCKIKQQRNQRYKDHKIVRYEGKAELQLTENMICPKHKEKYRLYCFTEEKSLCISCNSRDNPKHKTHYVKSLNAVLEQAEREKENLKKEIQDEVDKVETAISYFSGIINIFLNQKQLYLKSFSQADFEVIYKLVERKHAELKDKVSSIYDQNLRDAYQYVEGLQAIKETINSLEKIEIKVDLDQISLNKAIMYRLREIETELDFEMQSQDMDLIESRFINEPFQKIEKSLLNFYVFPIQNTMLNNMQRIFVQGNSKIINVEHFTSEILFVMPQRMKRAELIQQHSSELLAIQQEQTQFKAQQQQKQGEQTTTNINSQQDSNVTGPLTSAWRFHAKCDNRGPTLMQIKANEGHIFGGFNPTSWVAEFLYSECDDAYLFSITDGQGRKPIKCPVKIEKKEKAIKQNETSYSPAFGEVNISDLFIAFKNLSNSYCMLGNVYKMPKGYKSETFLEGRHNDWKIDEIEVWAVSY